MRKQFSKIALAVFAVNSALSMAFASIPANCTEEIITLSKSRGFDMQAFMINLPLAVGKAKLQAKSPFGQPKDSDKTDIGITFGCLKVFPESPSEIASLLEDVSEKTAGGAVAAAASQVQPQYAQPQEQPQYVQPQVQYVYVPAQPQYAPPQEQPQYVQPQVQYVYLPQPCPKCPKCPQSKPDQQGNYRRVQRLIEDGIKKNKWEIQRVSAHLSDDEIDDLYEKNKKSAVGSAFLGATIGLGIGNYVQGNIAMGATQTIVDVLSFVVLSFGKSGSGDLSIVLLSANRILGLITPFVYTNNYNKALKNALESDNYSYSIDPLIVPKDGGAPAVGLAFNLRY